MSKARFNKKISVRNIAILLLIVLLFCVVLFCLTCWEKGQGFFSSNGNESTVSVVNIGDTEYTLNPNIQTMLVMGLDKFEGQIQNDAYYNDQQADFLMLLVIDDQAKTYSAIHINRDTMAEMNILGVAGDKAGTITQQIALSHTYGNGKEVSCRNTAEAVSQLLLDMKVNHYISVTMDAVPVFNDLVGGVQVEVLDDFSGIDDSLKKGETVTLRGEQALRYVRTRYGMEDSSNNTRMLRQQQYMKALLEQTEACMQQNENFIIDASVNMADYMVADRTVNQLQTLFNKLSSYTFNGIRSFEGDSFKGERFMEFYPDADSLKQIVVDLFYQPVK